VTDLILKTVRQRDEYVAPVNTDLFGMTVDLGGGSFDDVKVQRKNALGLGFGYIECTDGVGTQDLTTSWDKVTQWTSSATIVDAIGSHGDAWIQIPKPAWWEVRGFVSFVGGIGAEYRFSCKWNGTFQIGKTRYVVDGAASVMTAQIYGLVNVTAIDEKIELWGWSGATNAFAVKDAFMGAYRIAG